MLRDNTSKNRQKGILIASFGTLFFAMLDTSGKWLVQTLPVMEVVWLRFFIHTVISGIFLAPRYGWSIVKVTNYKLQFIRVFLMIAMTALNFAALQYLQLAQTGAVQFSVPIMIAVISSLWFKDHLPLKNWVAIIIGFFGVLIILNPFGHNFHPAMFLALINAMIYAVFNLITRKVAATDHPAATQLMSALGPTILLLPFIFFEWKNPSTTLDWIAVITVGLGGFLGHFCLALSYRYAKANVLSPFFYQQIIYMTGFGWLVFNQIPDVSVIIGAIVVVISGLYLLLQEIKTGDQHEQSS